MGIWSNALTIDDAEFFVFCFFFSIRQGRVFLKMRVNLFYMSWNYIASTLTLNRSCPFFESVLNPNQYWSVLNPYHYSQGLTLISIDSQCSHCRELWRWVLTNLRMVCSQFGMKQKRTRIPQHYLARLLKNYPRPLCAPSFIKSGTLLILQTLIFLFSTFFSIPYIYTRGEFYDASSGFSLWAKTLRGLLSMCFHFLSLYF